MEKRVKVAKLTLLVITILYFLISVLAVISEFNVNTNDDTVGNYTLYAFIRTIWWPFMVIALMVIAYILYSKKYLYAAIVETLLGGILLANVIRNIIVCGNSVLASTLSFILPAIFMYQGVMNIIKRESNKKEAQIKQEKRIEKKTVSKISSRKERR